ncbi:hypothetical protein Tco_1118643, partial [Tanacetum coccineum]
MLATGRKCILEGPYTPSTVTILVVPAIDDSPKVPEQTVIETILNMYPENKENYQSENEAIHLLLTGIGDEIYSNVDACKTAHDIFYKMVNEMIRNNLIVATMQVDVQFLQQLQPEWSRFVTIVKQHHELDIVSYHKLFDVLKQYQKEVNKIRAERIAKNANPLAVIAKPITPQSESASKEDSDPEQAQRDKDMQKNLALIAKYFKKIYKPTNNNFRTSSNSRNKNVDTSLRKPNRVKDYTYHKKKMLFCKQAKKGVPLQAEQADWLEDTDEEIN